VTAPQAWHMRRLRRAGRRAGGDRGYLARRAVFGRLTPATVSESLYRSYRELLGLTIARAEDRLGAGPLPDWAADRLGARPGRVMALARRRAFAADGRIAEVSSTWFDPDRAAYVARLP
jgi:GntR family transcriptional regulator